MGSFIHTVGYAEPETEELTEQAPAEASTNLDLAQGKPRCIPLMILDFSLNHYLCVKIDCALNL
jgi:hypothetical protein